MKIDTFGETFPWHTPGWQEYRRALSSEHTPGEATLILPRCLCSWDDLILPCLWSLLCVRVITPVSSPPAMGYQVSLTTPRFLCGFWGSISGSHASVAKYITHKAILNYLPSPVLCLKRRNATFQVVLVDALVLWQLLGSRRKQSVQEFFRPTLKNQKGREGYQHILKGDCLLNKFTVRQGKENDTVWIYEHQISS